MSEWFQADDQNTATRFGGEVDRRGFLKLSSAMVGASLLPGCSLLQRPPPVRKLNLLILGGTGFLGPATVDAALAGVIR